MPSSNKKKKKGKKAGTTPAAGAAEYSTRRVAAEEAAYRDLERKRTQEDEDLAMAMRLQEQEDQASQSPQETPPMGGMTDDGLRALILQVGLEYEDCKDRSALEARAAAAMKLWDLFSRQQQQQNNGSSSPQQQPPQQQQEEQPSSSSYMPQPPPPRDSQQQRYDFGSGVGGFAADPVGGGGSFGGVRSRSVSWSKAALNKETTVEDVMSVSKERTYGPDSSSFPGENTEWQSPWAATSDFKVQDSELEAMKGLYTEFLARYATKKDFVEAHLDVNDWSAWVLLTFLEYPFSVYCARKFVHATKRNAPQMKRMTSDMAFPLSVVVERVAQWRRLMVWCRDAVSGRVKRSAAVEASALRLLCCAAVGTTQPKVTKWLLVGGEDVVVQDAKAAKAAILGVSTDLARHFKNQTFDKVDELYGIQLPVLLASAVDLNYLGRMQLVPNDCKTTFSRTLNRLDDLFDDNVKDELTTHLLHDQDDPDLFVSTTTREEKEEDPRDDDDYSEEVKTNAEGWGTASTTRKCDNAGCDAPGTRRCACRLVSYCSKDCQRIHWPIHKELCPKRHKATTTSSKKKKTKKPQHHNNDDDEVKEEDPLPGGDDDDADGVADGAS